MRNKKILILVVIPVVVVSNIPPFSHVFDYALDEKHYRYRNVSGSFEVTDRSGNNLDGVKKSFDSFVKSNDLKAVDTVLYRSFWKNPLAFWRWHAYFDAKNKRYELPYKK